MFILFESTSGNSAGLAVTVFLYSYHYVCALYVVCVCAYVLVILGKGWGWFESSATENVDYRLGSELSDSRSLLERGPLVKGLSDNCCSIRLDSILKWQMTLAMGGNYC